MTSPSTAQTHTGHLQTHLPVHGKLRVYARGVTDVFLLLTWLPATFTGVILWDTLGIVPEGPGKGEPGEIFRLESRDVGPCDLDDAISVSLLQFDRVLLICI